jgi:hypothetical protein
MTTNDTDRELARIVLSQCADELSALLERVRAQEPYIHACRDAYFDQTMVLAHSHIDGAIRSLRGIVAHLSNYRSA